MKRLLLLFVWVLPVLSVAQTDLSTGQVDQYAAQIPVNNGCVSLTPDSYDFGNQPLDFASKPGPFYLLNSCNVSISVTSVNANGQAFTQTNNCVGTLMPNNFCEIDVVFEPATIGQKSQTLVVQYQKSGNQFQISGGLSGTGIHDVTFTPTSCNFGSVQIGDSAYCTVTIKNQEPQQLTIDHCKVSSYPPFLQETSCPTTLAKSGANGDSANITLEFSPEGIGVYSGQFAVTTDSPEHNPYTVPLTGVGLKICEPPQCCGGSGSCPPLN